MNSRKLATGSGSTDVIIADSDVSGADGEHDRALRIAQFLIDGSGLLGL